MYPAAAWSALGDSEVLSVKNPVGEPIPELRQRPEEGPKRPPSIVRQHAGDVFPNHPAGPIPANNGKIGKGEVATRVIQPFSQARNGERLAGASPDENIDICIRPSLNRFSDVWGGYLHIEQAKTGARIALPLALRLRVLGMTLGEVIDECRQYAPPGETLLRKSTGAPLTASSLSKAFASAFARAVRWERPDLSAPSLAEIRSLSERLYSAQGIDAQTLLGHRRAAATALYHDDRGLGNGGNSRCGAGETIKVL